VKKFHFVHKSLSCNLNSTLNVFLTISIFTYQPAQISELFYVFQCLSLIINCHFCLSVFTNTHHFCLFLTDFHTKFLFNFNVQIIHECCCSPFWVLATTALSSVYLIVSTTLPPTDKSLICQCLHYPWLLWLLFYYAINTAEKIENILA